MQNNLPGEFAWILSGRITSIAASIILLKMLTQEMSISEYGTLALGLTIFNLLTQIVMGSIGQGIGRAYIDAKEKLQYIAFKQATLEIFKNLTVLYLSIIILLISTLWIFIDFRLIIFILLLVVYSYIFGVGDIGTGLHNLARNRRESAIATILEQAVKIILISIMVSNVSLGINHVVISYMLSTLLVVAYHYQNIYKLKVESNLPSMASTRYWKTKIIKISGPASFWGLFVWVQQASDKWALQFFSNTDSVGFYSVLYQISYAPFLIATGFLITLYMPMIYSGKDNKRILIWLIGFIFVVMVSVVIFFNFYGVTILLWVVGEEYSSVASLMPFMIIAAGFYQAGDIISIYLMRLYEIKLIMYVKIITSIFCAAFNFIGAYYFGVAGVVTGLIFFGILYFTILLYWYFKKRDCHAWNQ